MSQPTLRKTQRRRLTRNKHSEALSWPCEHFRAANATEFTSETLMADTISLRGTPPSTLVFPLLSVCLSCDPDRFVLRMMTCADEGAICELQASTNREP